MSKKSEKTIVSEQQSVHSEHYKDHTNSFLMSIVGMVALVAIVVLVLGLDGSSTVTLTPLTSSDSLVVDSSNLVGQAIGGIEDLNSRYVRPVKPISVDKPAACAVNYKTYCKDTKTSARAMINRDCSQKIVETQNCQYGCDTKQGLCKSLSCTPIIVSQVCSGNILLVTKKLSDCTSIIEKVYCSNGCMWYKGTDQCNKCAITNSSVVCSGNDLVWTTIAGDCQKYPQKYTCPKGCITNGTTANCMW